MHARISMRPLPGLRFFLVFGSALLAGAGCGDDAPPGRAAWVSEPLPAGLTGAALQDIGFDGSRGLAVGGMVVEGVASPVLLERHAGEWVSAAATLPDSAVLQGLTFAADGSAIAVGSRMGPSPLILDERGGWSTAPLPPGPGSLTAVARADDGTLRAAGISAHGLAFMSTAPDQWTAESPGFNTAANDKGLLDVDCGGGDCFGCGYDDAGPPFRVLMRHAGAGWEMISGPFADTGPVDFLCVLAGVGGGLFLGGSHTDFSAGSADSYVALLAVRSTTGDWAEIVLPDAGALDSVNDILVTEAGDIYLACGRETMHLVRKPVNAPAVDEGPGTPGRIVALAEGPDGVIDAAGWSTADTTLAPVILRRVP